MVEKWMAAILLATALAGCTSDPNDVPTDGAPVEEVDCAPLVAEFERTTQEEYDALPEEEQLPEACADLFVAYIGPLTELDYTGCTYVGVQNLLPETVWGPPPEDFTYDYSDEQVVIVTVLLECSSVTHRNGTVQNTRTVLHWLEVNAHPDWEDDDLNHRYFIGGASHSKDSHDVNLEFGMSFLNQVPITVQAQHNEGDAWMGQFGYSSPAFSFTGHVNAGAEPATSDPFTTRYYWHNDDGSLGVFDSTITNTTQSIGAGAAQPDPFASDGNTGLSAPGAAPGFGFYGHGTADSPMDIHSVRVDLLDPSA